MANFDRAFGAIPIGTLNGGPYTGQTIECELLVGTDEDAFLGDWVASSAQSSVDGMAPGVVPYTVGTDVFGCITGFVPNFADEGTLSSSPNHRVGTEVRRVLVAPAFGNLFIMQSDEDGTALVAADVGANVDVTDVKGSTITGISAMELDSSTLSTNADTGFRLHGLYRGVGNEFGSTTAGDRAIWIISVNELTVNQAAGA